MSFSSSFGGSNGMPFTPRPDMGPDVGFGVPAQPGFGPAPIDGQNPIFTQPSPFQPPAPTPAPVPGFQPTWQQMGYSSLEAMKDAMDPGWRNSPGQIGRPVEEMNSFANNINNTPTQTYQAPTSTPTPPQMGMGNMGFGKGIGGPAQAMNSFANNINNTPTQTYQAPLQGTPMQAPSSVFQGGLKPAPRNFRPPARRGNLRSFTRR